MKTKRWLEVTVVTSPTRVRVASATELNRYYPQHINLLERSHLMHHQYGIQVQNSLQ
jgi:hypothetical protein